MSMRVFVGMIAVVAGVVLFGLGVGSGNFVWFIVSVAAVIGGLMMLAQQRRGAG
jgi:hypothetical protein